MKWYNALYCMSRHYFCYILFMIYCCFVALAYMFNNRILIIIGLLIILLLPNPESYKEIKKRYG